MKRLAFLLSYCVAFVISARAGVDPCLPPRPADQSHLLFQYTDLLTAEESALLDRKLINFARETSNRIAIVIVDTLCGDSPNGYTVALGQAWGMGQKGVDNGVMIIVKPTGPPGQRQVYIATGYGLEGAIPDATAQRVVDNDIIPRFRDSDYYGGLDHATDVLMALAKGEIDAKSYGAEPFPWAPVLFVLGFVVCVFMLQRKRVKDYARLNNLDFWTAWTLLNAASRSHGGSWGGFSGGGGSSGGGGFGGFGGGSFGGGGAGGSW